MQLILTIITVMATLTIYSFSSSKMNYGYDSRSARGFKIFKALILLVIIYVIAWSSIETIDNENIHDLTVNWNILLNMVSITVIIYSTYVAFSDDWKYLEKELKKINYEGNADLVMDLSMIFGHGEKISRNQINNLLNALMSFNPNLIHSFIEMSSRDNNVFAINESLRHFASNIDGFRKSKLSLELITSKLFQMMERLKRIDDGSLKIIMESYETIFYMLLSTEDRVLKKEIEFIIKYNVTEEYERFFNKLTMNFRLKSMRVKDFNVSTLNYICIIKNLFSKNLDEHYYEWVYIHFKHERDVCIMLDSLYESMPKTRAVTLKVEDKLFIKNYKKFFNKKARRFNLNGRQYDLLPLREVINFVEEWIYNGRRSFYSKSVKYKVIAFYLIEILNNNSDVTDKTIDNFRDYIGKEEARLTEATIEPNFLRACKRIDKKITQKAIKEEFSKVIINNNEPPLTNEIHTKNIENKISNEIKNNLFNEEIGNIFKFVDCDLNEVTNHSEMRMTVTSEEINEAVPDAIYNALKQLLTDKVGIEKLKTKTYTNNKKYIIGRVFDPYSNSLGSTYTNLPFAIEYSKGEVIELSTIKVTVNRPSDAWVKMKMNNSLDSSGFYSIFSLRSADRNFIYSNNSKYIKDKLKESFFSIKINIGLISIPKEIKIYERLRVK